MELRHGKVLGPGLAEAIIVWALFGVFTLAVFVTYWRIPPHELYHVSESGLAGGASRALVFLSYPTALAAIAILPLTLDRMLAARPGRPQRGAMIVVAAAAFVLCAVVAWPGTVDQSDLDAKPVNALPAGGCVLALGLTAWAAISAGIGGATPHRRGDRLRIVVGGLLVALALPWIFAELGFYISDFPLLGSIFRAEQVYESHPSVHLGDHHGMEGVLLVLTALLLTRELHRMREGRLRTALALYLSVMIAYGLGNVANDAWLEQIVKRGWVSWEIPSVVRPELIPIWGLLLAVAIVVHRAFWRHERLGR